MRNFYIILIFLCFVSGYSQQEGSKALKGEYFFSNALGFTTISHQDFKLQAGTFSYNTGVELYLSKLVSIIPEVSLLRSNSNYDFENQGNFAEFSSIVIPLSVRFITDREKDLSLFGDIGGYAITTTSFEIFEDGNEIFEGDFKAFNFGLHFNVGIKYNVFKNINVKLLIKTASDLLSESDTSTDRLNINNNNSISLNFGFAF